MPISRNNINDMNKLNVYNLQIISNYAIIQVE